MSGFPNSQSLAFLANAFETESKKYGNLIYQTLSGNVLEVTNVSEDTWNSVSLPTDNAAVSFLANNVVIQSFIPSVYVGNDTYITPIVLPNAGLFMNELTLQNYNKGYATLSNFNLASADNVDTLSLAWSVINPAFNTTKKTKVISARFVDTSI